MRTHPTWFKAKIARAQRWQRGFVRSGVLLGRLPVHDQETIINSAMIFESIIRHSGDSSAELLKCNAVLSKAKSTLQKLH